MPNFDKEFIEILKIFKKRADSVQENKELINKGHSFSLSFLDTDKIVRTSLAGIKKTDDDILAVLVRNFWQQKSNIEINKVVNKIFFYRDSFDEDILNNAKKIKEQYNKFLSAGIKFTINSEKIKNNDDLLKLFFNGEKFHTDIEKFRLLGVCENSEAYLLMKQSFYSALQFLAATICCFNNTVVKNILDIYKDDKNR